MKINKIVKYISKVLENQNVRVFLFFLVAAFIAHLDKFILRDYAFFKTHDTFELNWPVQFAFVQRLFSFQMPGWFPDYVGGYPFFNNDINWLFSPMILAGLFRGTWNYTAITVMQFILAGFGAYLFLQYFFRTNKYTSILGGILWALGTFDLAIWKIFDLAVIPLLLYCTNKIAVSQDKKEKILLLFGLLLSATNIQFAKGALFIAFFQLFFIFVSNHEQRKQNKVLITFVLVWIFITIINLPVVLTLIASTAEGSRSLEHWIPEHNPSIGQSLWGIINLIIYQSVPYFGYLGILIYFCGFLYFKQWNKLTKNIFYFYVLVVIFMIFIDKAVWFQTLRQSLPLKEFRLIRLVLPGPFIVMLIASVNFENFLQFIQGSFKKLFTFVVLVGSTVALIQFWRNGFPGNYIEVFTFGTSAAIFLTSVFILKKIKAGKSAFIFLIIMLIFSERLVNMNLLRMADSQPPSFKHFFQSNLFDKFRPVHKYGYRIAFINWHPTVGVYNGYQVAGGYASQYMKRYALFWASVLSGEKEEFLSYTYRPYLIDKEVERESHPPKTIKKPTFNTDLLALHNVRYIFSFNEIEKPEHWGLIMINKGIAPDRAFGWRRFLQTFLRTFKSIDYYVYEVKNWLPRVYLVKDFIVAKDERDLKHYLDEKPVLFLKDNIIYNSHDPNPSGVSQLKPGRTINSDLEKEPQIISYSDNIIIIDAWTKKPQQLVLIENFSNDWKATVNGKYAQVYPAYGVFRSVLIKEGNNRIIFEYKPAYLIPSFWISGLGGILCVVIGCFWALKNNKGNK
jgi:hypothetical protein